MPLSRDNEKMIRKNYEAIVNEIQKTALDSFIDRLFINYILTSEDKERIDAEPTTSGKVRILLDRLLTGPANGYSIFIGKLKEDKCYEDLAKQIEETDLKDEENLKPETVVSWISVENLTEEKAVKRLNESDLLNFSKAIRSELFSSDFFRKVSTRLGLDQKDVHEIEKEI